MTQKEYEKKLKTLPREGQIALAKEFGEDIRFKDRLRDRISEKIKNSGVKVAKSFGAVALSALIALGMVSCDDNVKDKPPIVDVENNPGNKDNEIKDSESDNKTPGGENTNPGGDNTNPGGENTNPGGDNTNPGGENTNPGGDNTNPGGDNTNPGGDNTNPGEEIVEKYDPDMPADEDGFVYPEKIANRVHNSVVLEGALEDAKKYADITNVEPKILFVELGEISKTNTAPVNVFVEYEMNQYSSVYAKFEYTIRIEKYRELENRDNFVSYKDYAEKMADAVSEAKFVESVNAGSDAYHMIPDETTKNMAKIIDERFVDVDVFYETSENTKEHGLHSEICGFGYDEEGNSYFFRCRNLPPGKYSTWKTFRSGLKNGELTRDMMIMVDTDATKISDSIKEREDYTTPVE